MGKLTGKIFISLLKEVGTKHYIKSDKYTGETATKTVKGFNLVIRNGYVYLWGSNGELATAEIDDKTIEIEGFLSQNNARLFRIIKGGEISLESPDPQTLVVTEHYKSGSVRSTIILPVILHPVCMSFGELETLGVNWFWGSKIQPTEVEPVEAQTEQPLGEQPLDDETVDQPADVVADYESELLNNGSVYVRESALLALTYLESLHNVSVQQCTKTLWWVELLDDETVDSKEVAGQPAPAEQPIDDEPIELPPTPLTDADFYDESSFEGRNLSGSRLSGSDIVGVDFYNTILDGSIFTESYLEDVNMDSSRINDCDFSESQMDYIYWASSKGSRTVARHAQLRHAIANDTNFTRWDFSHSNAEKSIWKRSNLQSSLFKSSNLQYANFDGADLSYCNFTGADLSYASFKGANLTGATFSRANLYETDFTGARLNLTWFTGARALFTKFCHCRIVSTVFKTAHIRFAEFDRSVIINTGILDADIQHVSMREVDFTKTSITSDSLRHIADIFRSRFAVSR